jgi:hypothetical protein
MKNSGKSLNTLSALFLVAVLFLAWGFSIGKFKVFPYHVIEPVYSEIEAFILGDPEERSSLVDKLLNDFGGVPKRFLWRFDMFQPDISSYQNTSYPEGMFKSNRLPPKFYSRTKKGYYLIYGVFEFADARYGAILINSQGNIIRTWKFHLINRQMNPGKGGFDYQCGTLISNLGYTLQAQDFCGKRLWKIDDVFAHHSIEPNGEGYIWNYNQLYFEKRSSQDGSLAERFSIFDVIEMNPDLHILEPRLKLHWKIKDLGKSIFAKMDKTQEAPMLCDYDPFHLNDITPLTGPVTDKFPDFQKGDLLISSRYLNLVFVLRPGSKEILWHRFGVFSRQHDPDFNQDGRISIFDNNIHNQYSRIIALDIKEEAISVLLDGRRYGFMNIGHGNHQVLDDASIVFVDCKGRVIHAEKDGTIRFSFINLYDDTNCLELRNVWYLSDSDFQSLNQACTVDRRN